MRISQTMGVLN